MEGLKPCPFCGGMPELYMRKKWWSQSKYALDYRVHCVQKDCIGKYIVKYYSTEELAEKAWNRRASDD